MFELLIQTEDKWKPKGRCNDNHGTLSHLFFSDDIAHQARAKAMCAKCPVSSECLDAALTRKELWGIWGGELFDNGRIVLNKRGRGRPPKAPRSMCDIAEVPVPPNLVHA